MAANSLLEVQNLRKEFEQSADVITKLKYGLMRKDVPVIKAVDDVNIDLEENQVQGVIGESGCGKSTLLMTLIGLYDISDGNIVYDGKSLNDFTKSDWKDYRRRVQIIFQDPFNSFDPKFTVKESIEEPLQVHDISYTENEILDMLEQVGLNPPRKYLDRYPKNLSGGELQRISIARALILEPDIILADEPVSMLDVSTQAAVLNLLSDLTDKYGVSMLYISHDLSTVSYVCDMINVMYLGRIVERAPVKTLLQEPKHPYTKELIKAIPIPNPHLNRERTNLKGVAGDPSDVPTGCRFRDRCPEAMDVCKETPQMVDIDENGDYIGQSDGVTGAGNGETREVACHLYYDHETVSN